MRIALVIGLVMAVSSLLGTRAAEAVCSGASAPAALQNFDKDPLAWIKANTGKTDVGEQVLALSAAAVNANDAAFGAAFVTLLQNASGDDGSAIGKSLAGLNSSCSDPHDPTDKADKRYIALNIVANLPTNASANAAYGAASGPQSSSTGAPGGAAGGSGSGLGVGTVGTGPASGGDNNGNASTGGTTDLANAVRTQPTASAGSEGATTSTVNTGSSALSTASAQ